MEDEIPTLAVAEPEPEAAPNKPKRLQFHVCGSSCNEPTMVLPAELTASLMAAPLGSSWWLTALPDFVFLTL